MILLLIVYSFVHTLYSNIMNKTKMIYANTALPRAVGNLVHNSLGLSSYCTLGNFWTVKSNIYPFPRLNSARFECLQRYILWNHKTCVLVLIISFTFNNGPILNTMTLSCRGWNSAQVKCPHIFLFLDFSTKNTSIFVIKTISEHFKKFNPR